MTERYEALYAHYGIEPIRNPRGLARENGAIESPRGHLKKEIRDSPPRDSAQFDDPIAYCSFVGEIVSRKNARIEPAQFADRDLMAINLTSPLDIPDDVSSSSGKDSSYLERATPASFWYPWSFPGGEGGMMTRAPIGHIFREATRHGVKTRS